jgi:hypothetical protein
VTQPPRETIGSSDLLYRRIVKVHVIDGEVQRNAYYASNGKPDPYASVDLARLTDPNTSAARFGKPDTGIGELEVPSVWELGLSTTHDPEDDWYPHSLIEVVATKELCRALAKATKIIKVPER